MLRWLKKDAIAPYGKVSFSQCGEDLIVDFVLTSLGVRQTRYLDLGAYHPAELSNTCLFYRRGGNGVCVEPNPDLCAQFKTLRKRDVCLNVGVGPRSLPEAEFYVLSPRTLSTFSAADAKRLAREGRHRIERIVKVPVMTVTEILRRHFPKPPDFVSLDAEGTEMDVLAELDFNDYRPAVFCIETLTFAGDNTEAKQRETIAYMTNRGYLAYADTYINTIFVDRARWQNRGR